LQEGLYYDGFLEDGRIVITVMPAAWDALCKMFEARQRHLPVPEAAVEHMRIWQSHVCGASRYGVNSRERCTIVVDGPHARCPQHQAIGRLHPQASNVVDSLSPRARSLFDSVLATEPSFFGWNRTGTRHLVQRMGVSATTVNRALRELDAAHLAWRGGEYGQLVIHPAIAYFGGYDRHREAIDSVRLDRRAAFQHLEPPEEEDEAEQAA
jgi:hypothetical protein